MDIKDNETISKKEINTNETENSVSEELSEDVKEENSQVIQEEKEPLMSFEYDVKNSEEEEAFLTFQKKYVYKRNWIITAAFSVLLIIFIISIIKYSNGYLNYVLAFISAAMIFITWYNTRRIRKYLVSALKTLEDDRYIFSLYDDKFKIETIMTEEDKKAEDFVPIPPRIVNFSDLALNVIEKDNMFIIILKKETIYVLSKRFLDDSQQEFLRKKFTDVLGEDFEKI